MICPAQIGNLNKQLFKLGHKLASKSRSTDLAGIQRYQMRLEGLLTHHQSARDDWERSYPYYYYDYSTNKEEIENFLVGEIKHHLIDIKQSFYRKK